MYDLGEVVLRKPEPHDVDLLYSQKNTPEIADLLGGFVTGYSRADIAEWVDRHRGRGDESIWVIASVSENSCIGHVGFYRIDHRIRSSEFAIMLGDKDWWGKGIGKRVTKWAVDYGFRMLNLNRVHLTVLADNSRAIGLYEGVGFEREGVLRQAQYKNGRYLDVIVMSVLREAWNVTPSE